MSLVLPDGRNLVTLDDARRHLWPAGIYGLPKARHRDADVNTAKSVLIVVEGRGPVMRKCGLGRVLYSPGNFGTQQMKSGGGGGYRAPDRLS